MNNIIEAEFREITDLNAKPIEELAVETNNLYQQLEAVSNIGLMLMAEAGQRLLIIKDRLPHGTFENWCNDNLTFSKSKAEKMMKFAQKVGDENSIFSKTETFTDLKISMVTALLTAPEDIAKEVIENPDTRDMTVRELKAEIARLQSEKEEKETITQRLEDEISKLKEEQAEAERRIEEADQGSLNDNSEEIKSLNEQVEKLKAKIEKDKAKIEKLKSGQADEIEKVKAEMKETFEKEASEKVSNEIKLLKDEKDKAIKEVERLNKLLDVNSNEELTRLKILVDDFQTDFQNCIKAIENINNEDISSKMKIALKAILKSMADRLGE